MGNFHHLPTDILLDIITRLQTETVLDCKLVCKPWRNLVSHHPSFSRLHLTHLNHSITDSGKQSFLVKAENMQLHYFEYDKNNDEAPVGCIKMIKFTAPFEFHYSFNGSFNGVVCLCGYKAYPVYICNPMTKQYALIPEFDVSDRGDQFIYWSSGFGYLPSTNEYKVVKVFTFSTQLNIVEVLVYTLGSGNGWKSVGRFDIKERKPIVEHGAVFVDGALHWVDQGVGSVFLFDLMEEKFREKVSQPPLPTNSCSIWFDYTIGELGGVLYYSIKYRQRITKCTCFDMWLLKKDKDIPDMNEQVEHEPSDWSKVFSIPGREPLAFTKGGGVLCFDYWSLGIYDSIASNSKNLVDFNGFSQIIPHRNTLFSLKELGEKDVYIMESAETEETENRDLTIASNLR
ncbi:F-box protein At3g07870-like [Papaver somniferum]|uniref:F-box protein At3g07870-like n=1 Tax=Papaver somniferum TaxID=3469 RepID=UPI000E703DE2|nr:F-box protein At3g07870-like [Papaver somniferum]